MQPSRLERRDFHRLTLAALGGALSGAIPGCGDSGTPPKGAPSKGTTAGGAAAVAATEMHLCHGLNTCKGKGAGGKNDCAGQGSCATAKHHTCKGDNECKGQGGCGKNPGQHECKGKGECSVPLMDEAWKKVHDRLEADMKKAGKTLGKDPGPKSG